MYTNLLGIHKSGIAVKIKENIHQRALRKWIVAGIQIPEVIEGNNGDSRYLLNNMIAKYTLAADTYAISELAHDEFIKLKKI